MADKIDKLTDEIAETLRELYESTENQMLSTVNNTLVEPIKPGENFKAEQLAKKERLKKLLTSESEKASKLLDSVTKNAAKMAGISPKTIQQENGKNGRLLLESALSYFVQSAISITRLERTKPLYEAIFEQTQQGIENGLPITTKSGRQWGYKEYMEMNVRTTIQHEIQEKALKAGTDAGVVFFLCNSFSDCANDHKDYQGRIYYNRDYKSFNLTDDAMEEIGAFIRAKQMLSIQEVQDGDPWLSTRPNCRHKFSGISIEQALGTNPKVLLKALKLETGTYKPENYEDMQRQRYNERQIRYYKNRKNLNESSRELVDRGSEMDRLYRQQITKDNIIVKRWQMKQRNLLESNPNLDRDYRRETRSILLNDLGARSTLARERRTAP